MQYIKDCHKYPVSINYKMGNKGEKEDTARRRVLKTLVELRNEHKIAAVLIWVTRFGTVSFGTDGMKEKAEKAMKCTCKCTCAAKNTSPWQGVIENDEKNISKKSCPPFEPGMDILDYVYVEMGILPPKLPMKLELMVYNDLAKWLRPQIVKNRHARGFTGVRIAYKDMSWCPSFWPEECNWMEVSNFSHWDAIEYTGTGDLTSVLKTAVENCLAEKNINPDDHVLDGRDKKKEKRKEKWRGKHSNPEVSFILVKKES